MIFQTGTAVLTSLIPSTRPRFKLTYLTSESLIAETEIERSSSWNAQSAVDAWIWQTCVAIELTPVAHRLDRTLASIARKRVDTRSTPLTDIGLAFVDANVHFTLAQVPCQSRGTETLKGTCRLHARTSVLTPIMDARRRLDFAARAEVPSTTETFVEMSAGIHGDAFSSVEAWPAKAGV